MSKKEKTIQEPQKEKPITELMKEFQENLMNAPVKKALELEANAEKNPKHPLLSGTVVWMQYNKFHASRWHRVSSHPPYLKGTIVEYELRINDETKEKKYYYTIKSDDRGTVYGMPAEDFLVMKTNK